MDKKLVSIIYPYDKWANDEGEEKNRLAKEALYAYCLELKKRKPAKKYENNPAALQRHMSYLPGLFNVRKALVQQQYMRVCNELVSLMHYEPFFQRRIYYNIINLLEEFLGVEDRSNA